MNTLIDINKKVRVTEIGDFHGQEGTVEEIWWDKRPVEVSVKLDDLERNVIFFRNDLDVVVPLPKPVLKFKVGDRVRYIEATPNSWFHGKEGTVVNIYEDDADLVDVEITKTFTTTGSKTRYLEKIDHKAGDTIEPKDIAVGMVVKVSYTTRSGDFEQVSTKQGTVTRISKLAPYVKSKDGETVLGFNSGPQVYTLVKAAPKVDEITAALKEAKPGSVAQIEDGGTGKFILTYVKVQATQNGAGRWMKLDSRYTTSTLVSEGTVRSSVQSLDQILIKH